ncbi:MAG: efflux RND transporter periplasmic adaptor subunit [Myxococcales bacterium]|nr:efflux RND transporter periplasmic adaptor subunit [Myxococcales bacterium]
MAGRFLLPLLLLLASACTPGGGGGPSDEKADAGDAGPPAPVETQRARVGPISDALEATAAVEARNRATLRARASGTVEGLAVEEGAAIKQDDVLARIDQPTLATLLGKAKAEVERTDRELRDARRLAERGLLAATAVDTADFAARQARLEVKRLETERELGRVVSPLTGVVVARHVQAGEAVSAGAALFDVADINALEAQLRLPERHLARLKPDLPVEVEAEGLGDARLTGRVERIAPTVDARSGTVKVTVALGDGRLPDGRRLRPGMYIRARIVVDTRADAILVPRRAVIYEDDRPFAFRVRDGKVAKLALELGYAGRDDLEVRAPVAAGDELVVFGHRGLQDGAKVRVVAPPTASPDAGPPKGAAEDR